jgi:uncharacterized membrane protein YcaP (DUF421 family)
LPTSISNDLFTIGVPVLEKAIRTVAIYGGIVVLLRLGGKRDLAQLNTFDLMVLLLLSNVVQNAIIGPDNSVTGGLLGATILVATNSVLVHLTRRSPKAIRLFEGRPTVVVRDGQVVESALRDLGLTNADIVNAIQHQGANSIHDVMLATLEPGGSIVIELQDASQDATRDDIARLEAKLDRLLDQGAP